MKVLIIDGSNIFRKTIGNLFSKLGYDLVLAENIKQATKEIKKNAFNLILVANELDDGLGMNFAEVCRDKSLVTLETPIFLTTTSTLSNEYLREILLSGVTEVIAKNSIKLIYDQLESYAAKKLIHNTQKECHILYIEDELDVAEKTMSMIKKIGAKITHFTGTDGVFEFLMHNSINLIISDVLVHGEESVLSLIYRLRNSHTTSSIIPILVVTGADNISRRIEFFHIGIDDYLIKPVIEVELLARIKNLLIKSQFLELVTRKNEQLANLK